MALISLLTLRSQSALPLNGDPLILGRIALPCTCSGTRPWLHGPAVPVGAGSPSPERRKGQERSFTEISIASPRAFLRDSVAQITTRYFVGFRPCTRTCRPKQRGNCVPTSPSTAL